MMTSFNRSLPTLIVIAGPTAVGKTRFSIELAQKLGTEILSCDSRQFYKELNIGTAKPTTEELSLVLHHFIGHLSVDEYYNISKYEQEALRLLDNLFITHREVLLVGGSGLYIDALCRGVDVFPDPDPELRNYLKGIHTDEGIEKLRDLLKIHDPSYYYSVDLDNPARLMRALEVTMSTGIPYSTQRQNQPRIRNFNIIKICLNLGRAALFERINLRVDEMIHNGLIEEARSLYPYKHLNALNTVGYKELFEFIDEHISLEQAIENIKTNTRRYAKRQLTWFRKDKEYEWFEPDQVDQVVESIGKQADLSD
jgi:tRNA dimethylallyltransferase